MVTLAPSTLEHLERAQPQLPGRRAQEGAERDGGFVADAVLWDLQLHDRVERRVLAAGPRAAQRAQRAALAAHRAQMVKDRQRRHLLRLALA